MAAVHIREVHKHFGGTHVIRGVSVDIATQYWQKSTANDPRVTIAPDVRVPLSSKAFFRGGDPVLAAALAYKPGR